MALISLYKKVVVFFVIVVTLAKVPLARNLDHVSCTSEICEETGKLIINNVNNSVDACTHFFRHACGGWIANHPISDSDQYITPLTIITQTALQELKILLEKNGAMDTGVIRKAKDFYKTCINRAAIDKNLQQNLKASIAGNGFWPMIGPLNHSNDNYLSTWQQIHENVMHTTEYAGLFQLSVDIRPHENQNIHVITLLPVETPGYDFNYLGLKLANFYTKASSESLKVPSDIEKMLEFEAKLKQLYSETINIQYFNTTTIKEAQHIWDNAVNNLPQYKIDWLSLIKRRFEDTGITIDENEKLAITFEAYLSGLGTLLRSTSIKTIVNYIFWYAVSRGIESVHSTDFENKAHPASSCPCCIRHRMVDALSFMYAKKHFNGPHAHRIRESVSEMFHQIRETAKERTDNHSCWMDEPARKAFKDKIDDISIIIGYPGWYDEPGKVDKYYDELTVSSDYFENILAVNRFESRKARLKLRKPVVKAEIDWLIPSFVPDAQYHRTRNSICNYHSLANSGFFVAIPATLLQMPIFHDEQPAAVRFGSLGSIIAHEIFHAFDNTGVTIDKDGNFRSWWPESNVHAYLDRVSCVRQQFNQYSYVYTEIINNQLTNKTVQINGSLSLDENMSDNAGFSIGFRAFQRYKRLNPTENIKISALESYSDEKLYFYAIGNVFCDLVSGHFVVNQVMEHSVMDARIDGALVNIKAFSDTFGCASGSNMNPTDKCILWD